MGEGCDKDRQSSRSLTVCASHHLDVGWAVATVLRSRAFFAASNLGTRVQSPIEFTVGAARAWKCSTRRRAHWCWPTGPLGWARTFSTRRMSAVGRVDEAGFRPASLIGRTNFAAALVEGRGVGREIPFDPIALARRYRRGTDRHETISFCAELLLGYEPDRRWIEHLVSKTAWNAESARHAIAQLMASPEAQLC